MSCHPARGSSQTRFGGSGPGPFGSVTILHRGGLVDRARAGRTVLYQTSGLGQALPDRLGERALPGRFDFG